MDLSKYLRQTEITELNQAFDVSLEHDSVLVFWTGISPKLAKDWARKNNLKTLTMAMGSLYAENSKGSLRAGKSNRSWSKYMKGASWLFAQKACQNRYAIVLTNAPPNVYSTRRHSNYREIEEPILKGFATEQHTIQVDYVHPTVSGAAYFRYQVWPKDQSSEWFDFLECIAIKDMVKRIMQRSRLPKLGGSRLVGNTSPVGNQSEKSDSIIAVYGDAYIDAAQQKKIAERLRVKDEQQAARESKAAKQAKIESQQQAARGKKAAKRAKIESQQQAAREKKAAKRARVENEQQAAREKKIAKRLKVENEQQAAREKKAAKRAKIESQQQAAREKQAEKRARVKNEQQAARERKIAKRLKVENEQQAAREKQAAKQLVA